MFVSLKYRKIFLETQKQVRISHGKRSIGVRVIEFYCILKYYRCLSFKNFLLIHNPLQEFANQNDMTYIETSAKTSTNVEQAFMTMTAEMKNKFDVGVYQKPTPSTILTGGKKVDQTGSFWACSC